MRRLGEFFAAIFQGWIDVFVKKHGIMVAERLALWATFLTVFGAFFLTLRGLLNGVPYVIGNEWLLMGFYSILPSNAETCISACLAADVAAWLYRIKMHAASTMYGGRQ